jgi:hypothetical protein
MEMRMLPVAMCDDQDLMLPEAEITQHAIRHVRHRRAVYPVHVIKRDGQMVDGLLHTIRLVGRRAHEDARDARIGGRQVARLDPFDSVGRGAVPAGFEVAGQPCEAGTPRDLADHPSFRIARSSSSRTECNSSQART